MSEIADLTTRRARTIAQGFMAAYQRQRNTMRLVGVPSAEIVDADDGGTAVADLAACMTVASSLSPVGLTASVLDRMRGCEEGAYAVLCRAASAYFASETLRQDLGRAAAEPFRLLRDALPGA